MISAFFLSVFTGCDNLYIHSCGCKWHYFILVCGWVIFHCVYIWLFINLSVDGHLVCFHVLAIINTTAMNTGMHVFFRTMFLSLIICPGVGLLDHIIVLFLVFKGISILFSLAVVSTYIPNSVRGFSFLHAISCIYCL